MSLPKGTRVDPDWHGDFTPSQSPLNDIAIHRFEEERRKVQGEGGFQLSIEPFFLCGGRFGDSTGGESRRGVRIRKRKWEDHGSLCEMSSTKMTALGSLVVVDSCYDCLAE